MAKTRREELQPEPDPTAPLDTVAFLAAAQPVLAVLKDDLLERADTSTGVTRALEARWQSERDDQRTADAFPVWRRRRVSIDVGCAGDR